MSVARKSLEWAKLKNYQYELTLGLYMLEPWEKVIFSTSFQCFSADLNLMPCRHARAAVLRLFDLHDCVYVSGIRYVRRRAGTVLPRAVDNVCRIHVAC